MVVPAGEIRQPVEQVVTFQFLFLQAAERGEETAPDLVREPAIKLRHVVDILRDESDLAQAEDE